MQMEMRNATGKIVSKPQKNYVDILTSLLYFEDGRIQVESTDTLAYRMEHYQRIALF